MRNVSGCAYDLGSLVGMVGVDSAVLDEFRRLERRHGDLWDRANRGRAELNKQKGRVNHRD